MARIIEIVFVAFVVGIIFGIVVGVSSYGADNLASYEENNKFEN